MKNKLPPTHSGLSIAAIAIGAALAAGCASRDTVNVSPAAAAAPTAATAAAAPAASVSPKVALGPNDQAFALAAAANSMYGLAIAQLGVSRAVHPEVKAYAQMLVDHRTRSNRELMALLGGRGISPPASIPPDKQERTRELSAIAGNSFDGRFLRLVGIADHIADIGLFDQQSRTGTDPQLRDFASNAIPVLREHMRAAQLLVLANR